MRIVGWFGRLALAAAALPASAVAEPSLREGQPASAIPQGRSDPRPPALRGPAWTVGETAGRRIVAPARWRFSRVIVDRVELVMRKRDGFGGALAASAPFAGSPDPTAKVSGYTVGLAFRW